jgi:hypothetical protein
LGGREKQCGAIPDGVNTEPVIPDKKYAKLLSHGGRTEGRCRFMLLQVFAISSPSHHLKISDQQKI